MRWLKLYVELVAALFVIGLVSMFFDGSTTEDIFYSIITLGAVLVALYLINTKKE